MAQVRQQSGLSQAIVVEARLQTEWKRTDLERLLLLCSAIQ